ncbi:MAG TPA: DUF1028 domain-containing protein [Acetobacteraceae bacterium]|jgi:uncharacterized Ntn-hydrolase superfamily protein|nr:DUF1028 domain-containing protein [Acetobacteraceae bacterium]
MTFSLIGRCVRTGQIGAAVTTSSIAVGARCTYAAAGVGAVLTQHRTDPRLGPRGIELLRSGCSAQETLDALVASTPLARWRQLAVLDAAGNTAAYSGTRTKPEMSEAPAQDACAIGNILASALVPAAMLRAFQSDPSALLAERLLYALEEGLAAGGENGPVRSAHLLVVERESFPLVDLRVDWHDTPVAELRALWNRYAPQVNDYLIRALDPDDPTVL